jgi:hypothetical protein
MADEVDQQLTVVQAVIDRRLVARGCPFAWLP